MYYPKSQIKTNLLTRGGEFVIFGTNQEYKGYYYLTSNGQAYSGKSPNDPTSQPLLPNSQNLLKTTIQGDAEGEVGGSFTLSPSLTFTLPSDYVASTNLNVSIVPSLPKQSYPVVTENDYKTGEFQRYFIKKSNEPVFLEISLDDYRKYVNQDRSTMFELYIPFQINWILTGDKEQVYQTNRAIVIKAEQDQNLPGFTQYFRDRFTQFYK
jgi:hypothetical protein